MTTKVLTVFGGLFMAAIILIGICLVLAGILELVRLFRRSK